MLWIRTVQQAASVRALSQAISLIKRLDGRAQDTGVNLDEEEAAMVGAVGAGAAPAPRAAAARRAAAQRGPAARQGARPLRMQPRRMLVRRFAWLVGASMQARVSCSLAAQA